MVGYLTNKFQQKANPTYVFKAILSKELDEKRNELRSKVFETIPGSSKFQCIDFKPGSITQISYILCVCEKCSIDYGKCDSFTEYGIISHQLNKVFLRSREDVSDNHDDGINVHDSFFCQWNYEIL